MGAVSLFAVDEPSLPTWDLVLCTVGRREEPARLLDSLQVQTHRGFRVVVVDQNDDARLAPVRARYAELDVLHVHAPRGLSRSRNAALPHLRAELVGFPDDDCAYPADLLERVGRRFASDPALDGLTGRDVDPAGRGSRAWPDESQRLTTANVWYHGLSTRWSAAEEVDYLIRALKLGARVEFDPDFAVEHALRARGTADLSALGRDEGGSVGYLLRKHGYPRRTVARMFVRPVGGAALSLARRDPAQARFHLSTLRGRLAGYSTAGRSANCSNSSA